MMIQFGLSIAGLSTAGRASDQPAPEPGDTTSVTLDAFSRDRTIFDSGAARGEDAVAIPLTVTSVDAPDGREVEVRFVSADTGAEIYPWRRLSGTLSGGTLSAPYFQPTGARSTHWLRPQARVVGSWVVTQAPHTCGVGHVWAIWEQSNWARIFNDYSSGLAGLYNPALVPDAVQVMHWTETEATEVNDGNTGGARLTPAMMDFANALQAVRPGEKFLILGHCKGGSSYDEALTDSNALTGSRDWNNEVALHQYATADGAQVGVVWNAGWTASNYSNDYVEGTLNKFIGKNLDGAPFDPTAAFPGRGWSANTTYGADHGGLYDWTYTKFGYVGPHGRARRGPVAGTVATFADIADYKSGDDDTYRKIVTELDQVMNGDPAAFPELLPYVGTTHGAERGRGILGDGDDYAHMRASDELGRQRLARIGAHNMMQTLGWMASPLPRLDSRHDEPGGAWSDQWIDGNNTLTTLRKVVPASPEHAATVQDLPAQGATIPADEDHRTEVMGWAINRVPAQRAELHIVTQAEVDAGHPAGVGQVVARVWPNDSGAFSGSDEIIYGVDHWPGYLVYEDGGNLVDGAGYNGHGGGHRTFLDWLVADVGQPSNVIDWIPVQHQSLAFALPTTLPVPAAFFAPNGVYLTTPQNSGARTATRHIWVLHGRVDDLRGGAKFLSSSGDNTNIQIANNGTLTVKNGADDLVILDVVQQGIPFYVEIHVEPGNKIEAKDEDGTVIATTPASQVVWSIAGKDQLSFLALPNGRDKMGDVTMIEMAVYFDATDTSGTPDYAIRGVSGAPYYALIGFAENDISGGPISDGAL